MSFFLIFINISAIIKLYDMGNVGECLLEPILYRVLRPIITILFKIVFRPVIIGEKNIPKSGRVVLAGNHTSYFDPLLLMSSTNRVIHFLAKDSLKKGIKGLIFKRFGMIFVNRKIHDKEALNKAILYLKEDKVIGIFPEGTINKTSNEIKPFKYGAVKMSKETNSLIVPFVISGKYKMFRKNIKIDFLDAYNLKEDLEKENEKLENYVINTIRKKSK